MTLWSLTRVAVRGSHFGSGRSGFEPWLSQLTVTPWHSFSSSIKGIVFSVVGHVTERNQTMSCFTAIPERHTCVEREQQQLVQGDDFWGLQFLCQEPAGGRALLCPSRALPGTVRAKWRNVGPSVCLSCSLHVLPVRQGTLNRGTFPKYKPR